MSEICKIKKVLTHNIALCEYENKEILLFGKGIAFKKNTGDLLRIKDAEKIYQIQDMNQLKAYEKLVKETSEDVVAVTEEIISQVIQEFGENYYDGLHVSLLDHLQFALKRLKENIKVDNIFLDETKYMYPKEYEFAEKMVVLINERLNTRLPDAEKSFICMHIHSATHGTEAGISSISVEIVGKCLTLIETYAHVKIEQNSLLKQRLITHLKFAIRRAMDKTQIANPLDDIIKTNYEDAYLIGEKLAYHVRQEYGLEFSKGEIAYLTMHIQNIVGECGKE